MKKNILGCFSLLATGFLVIAVPSITISQVFSENKNSTSALKPPESIPSNTSWSNITLPEQTYVNEQSYKTNIDSTYPLPKTTGNLVTDIAYKKLGSEDDYLSNDPVRQEIFLNCIQDTFLFTGGSDVYSDWDTLGSAKNFIGLFEENVRWKYTIRNTIAETYSTVSRFCFDTAKLDQTLKDINDNFDEKVAKFDPQNIIYVVGREDIGNSANVNESTLSSYENNLKTFILNCLKFRNNTSTVQIIKHWQVTSKYSNSTIFNSNANKYNQVVNKVVGEIAQSNPEIVKRILVVNPTIDPNKNSNYYANDGISLTRIGSNYLALLLYITGDPTKGTSSWTNYSETLSTAQPVEWAYNGTKNNLNLKVGSFKNTNGTYSLIVTCPDGNANDTVKWSIEFKDAGLIIQDQTTLNASKSFNINDIGVFDSTQISPITGTNYTNDYILTVFNKNGNPYNKFKSNLVYSENEFEEKESTLTPVQLRFKEMFEDTSKPLTWTFLGDSIDHGAFYTYGFDDLAKVTEKSIKQDWGRWDDTFINVAMSGDFTNRAVDPYLIESRISKYKADIISINLGISDGIQVSYDDMYKGIQTTLTDKQQFQNNFKKLVEAAKAANPNVIVVVNAINPNNYNVADQNRKVIPEKYNPYLQELFGSQDSPYSDYVIYNPNSFNWLNQVYTEYPYIINDKLFFGADSLHPSADAHIVKSKAFLESLGLNIENSYLSNYILEQFTKFKGTNDSNRISNIEIVSSSNKVVPKFKEWVNNSKNNAAGIGQIFLTLTNGSRIYYLLTNYGVSTNSYLIPYVTSGTYTENFWATTKTSLSANKEYSIAPYETSSITIS